MNKQRTYNLIEIHLATILLGFIPLFVQLVSADIIATALGRALFATITLILFLLWQKNSIKLKSKKDYYSLCFLGVLQALQWLTFFKSITVSSVAIGLLSLYTMPLFTTLLEPIFYREKIKIQNIIGSIAIFLGVALAIPEFSLENNITEGILWGILSALLATLILLLNRKYIVKYSSTTISLYRSTITVLLLMPIVFIQNTYFNYNDFFYFIIIGVFTAISSVLFIKSMKTIKAQYISSIASLEIIYGIIFAIFILGEIPSIKTALGSLIIFCATLYLTIKARK